MTGIGLPAHETRRWRARLPVRFVYRAGQLFSRWWPELAAILGTFALWELLARLLNFPFFPPFSTVSRAWWSIFQTGVLFSELLSSIKSLAIGYGAAAAAGLTLGGLMGRFRKVEYFFDPLIDINISTPTLVYIPVLFAIFGVSDLTRYAIVFLYAVFIIAANTATGIRSADPALLEMARSFGATESRLFSKITLPLATPLIMAGLRLGMTRAVKGMINGELFIALVGLGARLRYYGGAFQIDRVLALLLTIIFVASVMTAAVQIIDRRLTSWAETLQYE